jgi:hypothetical protein
VPKLPLENLHILNCVSTALSEISRASWHALNEPFAAPFRAGLLGSGSWMILWGMRQRQTRPSHPPTPLTQASAEYGGCFCEVSFPLQRWYRYLPPVPWDHSTVASVPANEILCRFVFSFRAVSDDMLGRVYHVVAIGCGTEDSSAQALEQFQG